MLAFVFCFSFSPQPPERTQMFVTSRLLEMGFSMRHIYWAMEAAGTALWSVSDAIKLFCFMCFLILKHLSFTLCYRRVIRRVLFVCGEKNIFFDRTYQTFRMNTMLLLMVDIN